MSCQFGVRLNPGELLHSSMLEPVCACCAPTSSRLCIASLTTQTPTLMLSLLCRRIRLILLPGCSCLCAASVQGLQRQGPAALPAAAAAAAALGQQQQQLGQQQQCQGHWLAVHVQCAAVLVDGHVRTVRVCPAYKPWRGVQDGRRSTTAQGGLCAVGARYMRSFCDVVCSDAVAPLMLAVECARGGWMLCCRDDVTTLQRSFITHTAFVPATLCVCTLPVSSTYSKLAAHEAGMMHRSCCFLQV
jgi:hypothetical protein